MLSRLYKLTTLEALRKVVQDLCLVCPFPAAKNIQTLDGTFMFSLLIQNPRRRGKRSRRKSKGTSRKCHFSLALINVDVMVLQPRRTASRRKQLKNYHLQKEWGKQVTAAGHGAPLWEQTEVRLHSTHQRAPSHVWNKALDKKRFLKFKIDLTSGFSSEWSHHI